LNAGDRSGIVYYVTGITVGLQTSADDVYILDYVDDSSATIRLRSKSLERDWLFEKGLLFPLVSGTDVAAYEPLPERQYIIFPYTVNKTGATLIDFEELRKRFPKTAKYLLANRERLAGREGGKAKGPGWYRYIYQKNMMRQATVKLCVPRLVEQLHAAYDEKGTHFLDNVDVGGVSLKPGYEEQTLPYMMALINSSLMRWFFPNVSAPFRGGWMSANKQFLTQLPIRTIDFSNKADKARHDKMVELVTRMMELKKQQARAPKKQSPSARQLLDQKLAITDQQIDALVYELYGLTEEEIGVVEGGRR